MAFPILKITPRRVLTIFVTLLIIGFLSTHVRVNVTVNGRSEVSPIRQEQLVVEKVIDPVQQAYDKGWVGLPGLKTVDCARALAEPLPNDQYPQNVSRPSLQQLATETTNCATFRSKYGFDRHPPVTHEEKAFPLAFVFLVHTDLDQVLFLLRALYRSHNAYCFSVDLRGDPEFLETLRGVAACVPNVFVAKKLHKIVYAGMSRLQADLSCMEELLTHEVQWRYAINMPGQEFPLKTNLEMVQIMKSLNGTNDVEGITEPQRVYKQRYKFVHQITWNKNYKYDTMTKTKKKHKPPPHQLTIVKGACYGSFSRAFVRFMIESRVSKDFLEWLKPVYSPDEYFYATLNFARNIDVPGGYRGPAQSRQWMTSYSLWDADEIRCAARKYVRHICIFSTGDLPTLAQSKCVLANKFKVAFHPSALHCLDQLLFNLTSKGITRHTNYHVQLRQKEAKLLETKSSAKQDRKAHVPKRKLKGPKR